MINALSPAVFLDRDGTMMEDCDYCSDPKDVRIFSGVPEALRSLKSRGFKLIVITNQSGIGRGLITLLHRGSLPPVLLGLEPFAEFACAVDVHLPA